MVELERYEIEICQDCLVITANGGNDDMTEAELLAWDERVSSRWPDEKGATWILWHGSDDEPSFSWQACEYCGDSHGGDRYSATITLVRKDQAS